MVKRTETERRTWEGKWPGKVLNAGLRSSGKPILSPDGAAGQDFGRGKKEDWAWRCSLGLKDCLVGSLVCLPPSTLHSTVDGIRGMELRGCPQQGFQTCPLSHSREWSTVRKRQARGEGREKVLFYSHAQSLRGRLT